MNRHERGDLERRIAQLDEQLAAVRRELGSRPGPAGSAPRPGRGRAPALLASTALLAVLAAPLALAGAGSGEEPGVDAAGTRTGEPVEIGKRNRSRRETGLIANNDGYSLRLSNVKRGEGGGAIFGCRSAPRKETCINADNLSTGEAFFFRSREGSSAGRFEVDGPNAVPFTTNATGLVENLNADKVDGRDASDLVGATGPAGPAGPQGPPGPPGVSEPERVAGSSASDSNSPKLAIATCPVGKRVIGTGASIDGGNSGTAPNQVTDVVIDEITPSPNLGAVSVVAYEEEATAANWSVNAMAICANVS